MAAKKKPLAPSPDSTGARAAPPVHLRVRAIRLLLESGVWSTEMAKEFAEGWGLPLAAVQRHAAEAQRQREAVLDAGAAARQIEADLGAALQEAFAQGDMGAVQRLLETRLKLHGIGAHRDPKNDPKPTLAPVAGTASDLATLPPWERSKHKEPKPS